MLLAGDIGRLQAPSVINGTDTLVIKQGGTLREPTVTQLTNAVMARQIIIPICGNAKVGATAGWVITGADNICHATLPASQTTATLVVPISGINIGETLTGVSTQGQVESAGGAVTLTVSIRKLTTAAADNVDTQLGTATTGSLVADTVISSANLNVTGLTEVLAEGETIYALYTGTTAAVTDIDLTGLIATVVRT